MLNGPIKKRHPVPEIEKVNGRWTIPNFQPTTPAFEWRGYKGCTGALYLVGCANYVKIGIARDFAKRFTQLDLGCPLPVTHIAVRNVPLAGLAYAEAWLHDQFSDRRVKGEWFAITADEAKSLLPKAVKRAEIYENACRDWAHEEAMHARKRRAAFEAWLCEQPTDIHQMSQIEQMREFEKNG